MKNIYFLLILVLLVLSCKSHKKIAYDSFNSVYVDTLLSDKISIRAILIDKNKVWFAADNNRFGFYDLKRHVLNQNKIVSDNLKMEFRSIAQTSKAIFILNVGNPANIFKISKETLKVDLVYSENHPKVFYDSMRFWNDREGITIGDPIEKCLNVLITRNGGETWEKIPCDNLPQTANGEAAFAASNTNIITKGSKVWVVSGGKRSRVFYSTDKGKSWEVFNTPITQGSEMTGIFTADFYNEKIGFIAGGNYEKPKQNFGNKAITNDGGKTWCLISENSGFGYTSCVQFFPHRKGKALVTVGASGLNYSNDSGENWKQLMEDETLYTIRFIDDKTAIAAGKNKMIKIKFK
jgi:photosystem II stability/assembly factor-like uncharacterized protein